MPNDYVFNVSAQDLKAQIYATNTVNGLTALQTDQSGNLLINGSVTVQNTVTVAGAVSISGVAATSSYAQVAAATVSGTLLQEDTSQQKLYSYYVINDSTSSGTLTVYLQFSPTTANAFFTTDNTASIAVAPGGTGIIVPKYYLDYTRLAYLPNGTASFTAYYNAQI